MCSPAHHRPSTAMSKDEKDRTANNSRKRASLSGSNTPQPKHSVEAIIGNGNHTENARIAPWTSSQPNYLANFLQTIHKQNQLPFGSEPVKLEPVEDNEEKSPPAKKIAVQQNDCGKNISENAVEIAVEQKTMKEEHKEKLEVVTEPEKKVPLQNLTVFPAPEQQQMQTPQLKKRKTGTGAQIWSEDSKEAKKINEQIALMLLMDNQSPSVVDRQGFRNFIKSVCPKYRMPGSKIFRDQILPHVRTLLCTDIANLQDQLQCNNPFGPSGISEVLSQSTRSGVSPANTVESGFQDDREDIENRSASSTSSSLLGRKSENFEALVQNSIRSAQNISQSFSYSIEVNSSGIGELDSDTSSSVCSDIPVQTKIDEFLEYASGRTNFSQEELSSLASRCYNLYTNFEEMEHLREELANALNIENRPLNLRELCTTDANKPFVARCLAFVVKHTGAILTVHEKFAIPHFIPFSAEEQDRLISVSVALDML